MSSLLSSFLLSQFPARWASCHFHCGWVFFVFSFHHGSFLQVGLLLCLASALQGPSQGCFSRVKSESFTMYVGGVCNFLGSVSSQQKLESADQCYSFVTAQSFIWQATKESTPSRCEGRLTPKERPRSILASAFYTFVSPPTLACPMQFGLFVSPEVLTLVLEFSLAPFSQAFLLFCFLATTILNSLFLF